LHRRRGGSILPATRDPIDLRTPERGAPAGTAYVLAAAFCWGLIGPISILALRTGTPAQSLAFWRALLSAAAFAALWMRARAPRLTPPDAVRAAVFGATGIGVMYGAFFGTVREAGAAVAAVLLYTGPAWVALHDRLVLGIRLGPARLGALVLALTGVALVSGAGSSSVKLSAAALAMGLASGIAFATHFTLAVPLFQRYGADRVYAIAMVSGAAVLLPLAGPSLPRGPAWPVLGFVVLISTVLASKLFAAGVVRLPATQAAVMATFEPVVAVAAQYLLWGSTLTALQAVGAGAILGGVTLLSAARTTA
jgi:drug/metabolite transporter, DME family